MLARTLELAALYVAAQTRLQFGLGRNLFGVLRYADGSLSGPVTNPRAGPTFVRVLVPALLPAAVARVQRPGWRGIVGAFALMGTGVGVAVPIGQRMPVLLTVLGLLVAALLIPRLRGPAAAAIVGGGFLVVATHVVSPPTFERLVAKFSRQMAEFGDSAYGVLAERSLAMVEQHPWTGRGYDRFRSGCPLPHYFVPWHQPGAPAPPGDGGGGAAVCVTHPHNGFL